MFSPIFLADTKIICDYNFVAPVISTLEKWPFTFEVYTKKSQEQFSGCKEFKNWFTCIVEELQGVQEF